MDEIKLDKDNYTKGEVQGFVDSLNKQINVLNTEVSKGKKAQATIDKLKKDNTSNAIKLAMSKKGIDESYFDLVDSEDIDKAQAKIEKLHELSKKAKIDNGFKPEEHPKGNEYEKFEEKGDVKGMLKSKLSNLF